jgi:hypothetical protein
MQELKENRLFIRKLQIFLQIILKGYVRTFSANAGKVYLLEGEGADISKLPVICEL